MAKKNLAVLQNICKTLKLRKLNSCKMVFVLEIVFKVEFHSFVCDAPARAFIKGIKCHSGYSSCEKCTEHGIYAGKVIFPSTDAPLRTD